YTRGVGERGYRYSAMMPTRIIMQSSWPEYSHDVGAGIKLFLCETRVAKQPALAGIKHLNRLENVLARNENISAEFAEGLMLSLDSEVIEGTMSNVFLVQDNVLKTPELSQCGVQGVMREHVLAIAKSLDIGTEVTKLSMNDVASADEMFMTNSLIGIWPVVAIGAKQFSQVRPVTERLMEILQSK
ncbi:MAG: aminodeoxychorismate lyase, partial [Gammaproteobacteria bacterium]|nr:aminodeoxychorismate lyase [Gammaproteobacteria bacterium]